MATMYPRIYLALDNCLLYKRYTSPDAWAEAIRGLGIRYIEASADNELDPLYMGEAYLADWVNAVKAAEARHGVKVCNLYSGHGSYMTLGIAHPDPRVRDNMVQNFFFPLARVAGQLGCGMGFFAHAFENEVLQDPERYAARVEILTDELARISAYAASQGCGKLGIEKMYTPHQYPWRNGDIYDLLRSVRARSGHDFYFTEDLGHHHRRFEIPTDEMIRSSRSGGVWLGTDRAFALAEQGGPDMPGRVREDIRRNPHLFAGPAEGDCYETLRLLGCYSPIVHLQQTNGLQSAHLPFTDAENARGIVRGMDVLRALKASYDREEEPDMPGRCDEICLTLELFSGTTSIMHDVLKDCRESVAYWRQFIPEDGMRLDELVKEA